MGFANGVPPRGAPAFFLILACLFGGFVCLGTPRAAADDLKGPLDRGGFQGADRRQIEDLFRQSAAEGIPQELLLPRLHEAVAKSAPAERLVLLLQRERAFLLQARELLQSTVGGPRQLADPASWARTANLLNGGLPAAQVQALVRASERRPGEYRPGTHLYVALLEWGLPADDALGLVEAVLSSSLSGPEFPGIVDMLAAGRTRRLSVEQTLERLAAELPRARSLQDLRRRLY